MSFKDFPEQQHGVPLLQRSLERGRLAHAYLFTGHQLEELEAIARTLENPTAPMPSFKGLETNSPDKFKNLVGFLSELQ